MRQHQVLSSATFTCGYHTARAGKAEIIGCSCAFISEYPAAVVCILRSRQDPTAMEGY